MNKNRESGYFRVNGYMVGAEFKDFDFKIFNLQASKMQRCSFRSCGLSSSNMSSGYLGETEFIGCDLSHADFRGVRMQNTTIIDCNVYGADFRGCEIKDCYIDGVDFTYANTDHKFFDSKPMSESLGATDYPELVIGSDWLDNKYGGTVIIEGFYEGKVVYRTKNLGLFMYDTPEIFLNKCTKIYDIPNNIK